MGWFFFDDSSQMNNFHGIPLQVHPAVTRLSGLPPATGLTHKSVSAVGSVSLSGTIYGLTITRSWPNPRRLRRIYGYVS